MPVQSKMSLPSRLASGWDHLPPTAPARGSPEASVPEGEVAPR